MKGNKVMSRTESNSSVNTYKTCPRKYAYHYGPQKRYVKPTEAMQLGNLVHEALAFALNHDGSKEAALSYLDTCFTNDVEKAKKIIKYYMPRIGPVRPYVLDGKPVIEKKFDVEVAGVRMLGYIDAVIYDRYNNVVLVDWKTRAGLLDSHQIELDNQLHMYVHVAREVLGIPVTKACQVQMNTTLPALPKLIKSGALSKTLGKTTMTAFVDEVQRLGVTEFLRMSYIDVDKASVRTEDFVLWIDRIQKDALMLPVANSSVCKWCQYTDLCLDK
jgi:CRISPR/Cas system-associated exonuclease Cas4 (RecB family)